MIDFTRRSVVSGLAVIAIVGPVAAESGIMTAPQAQKAVKNKEVLLIDVRSPEEWKQTGIAPGSHPISIHQEGFLVKLNKLMGGDKSRKVAFICATGSRSGAVQKELLKRGYSNVISVAEGMLGGRNGKGWIPRGMPVKKLEMAN
jgi:rhodanese-related sulfurtransferase